MHPRRSPTVVLLLLSLLLPATPIPATPAAPVAPVAYLRLVSGACLEGAIEEDGCCPGHPTGGLPRRVAAYAALRQEGPPVLAVEGGDFAFFAREPRAWEGTRLAAGLLARLGNAAWTPGERELAFGVDAVRLLADAMGSPVVSANLVTREGDLLFADARVCTLGGRTIGLTGVTAPRLLNLESVDVPGRGTAVVARDMAEALRPVVSELRRECAAVIVLAHASPAEAESLAHAVPGIDVIVVGHNPGYLEAAPRVAGAALLRGGNRGTHVASLGLHFDRAGRARADSVASIELLVRDAVTDPATAATVDSFLAIGRVLDRRARQALALDPGFRPGGDRYLGVEACARCHEAITAQWETGRHARAFRTLFGGGQAYNPGCLRCHMTGFGQPTGAELPATGGAPAESPGAPRLFGVQCEACHGRGSRHGEPDFTAPVTAATCVRCHDAANDPGFDFARALAQGIHGR